MEVSLDSHGADREQWERIAPLLPGKEGDPGRPGGDNRMFVEGVLWIVRTGAPWRDLPHCFGNWVSVWKRFRRWALKVRRTRGLLQRPQGLGPPAALGKII
jgi:transposase